MFCRAVLLGLGATLLGILPCAGQTPKPSDGAAVASPAAQQNSASPEQAQLLKTTEAFVRKLFAWGPDVKVQLGPLTQSPAPDYYDVPVEIIINGDKESGRVFVSKDGKTLLRGDLYDMSGDPFAENRAKIQVDGDPTKGPAQAPVTVVEFADFECPHCRDLYENLKDVETRFPQVRLVYKNFPLTQIHPWAQTAAIGARCAYDQSPDAFWKVHDFIFDNQDVISPENVWDKLVTFAGQAGLNQDTFKACLSSADAQKIVDDEHAQGVALGVNSTPTVFVNGRPIDGGDPATLVQYITFELAVHQPPKKQ
jgi:protein-disulfide isomerase